MSMPDVSWEDKQVVYDGITYAITGSDMNKRCVVGENAERNQYLVFWPSRSEKKIREESTGLAIENLSRDNCLVLDASAYTALAAAVLEYEEYCNDP